jgi:ABC-type nitrate/sulfonate/bicarbonate transport system permease component
MLKTLFIPFAQGPRLNIRLLAIVQLIILAVIWSSLPPSTGIPTPLSIATAWNTLALKQGLLAELLSSVIVIWEALILSAIISFGIAYLTTADLFKPIGTMVASLRFLGFAGLTFLFTLWTSNGQNLKLALLTFGMTVFLTRSTVDEIKAIPLESIDYGRSLGLHGWKITYEIGVRGRLHVMLDLLRQNAAIGWTLIVLVEGLVRSEGGIGAMLLVNGKYFNLSAVFAIQLTILAYGIFQDILLNFIRATLCPYSELNRSDR